MINFSFNIRNPFSSRWKCIKCLDGKLLRHKHWELQFDKTSDIIGFELRYTIRQDHAGLWASLALFGYDVIFNIYDTRHWDHEKDQWCVYGKENN